MEIGKLKQKVWLQQKTESRDSEGGIVATWNSKAHIWAAIEPLSGRELEVGKQIERKANQKITIRFQEGFGHLNLCPMRFVDNYGQIYNIDSVIDQDFTHDFLICYVMAISNKTPVEVLTTSNSEPLFFGV